MTELELRADVCRQARAWLGLREADDSYWPIMEIYNSIKPLPRGYAMRRGDFWCAAFVSAVAWILGLIAWIFPECSCPKMVALYKAAGRWMEDDDYCPAPGDIIFYDWDDTGRGDDTGVPDHVGIVVKEDLGTLTVVEGNCSRAVGKRYLCVGDKFIRGYGLPDYAAAASAINAHEDPEDETPQESPDPLPDPDNPAVALLGYGDAGWSVCSVQGMLIAHGFDCGPDGPDGDFGKNTRAALRRFQRSMGLPETGTTTYQTWSALLTGKFK